MMRGRTTSVLLRSFIWPSRAPASSANIPSWTPCRGLSSESDGKGRWSKIEELVGENGRVRWADIANALRGRSTKPVTARWTNNLDPNIKPSPWSESDDALLVGLVRNSVDDEGRPRSAEIANRVQGKKEEDD